MSTKDLIEALKRLQEYAHAAGHDGDWNLALSARAEVEAIEKAAAIIAKATQHGWPTTEMGSLNLQHSFEVLGSIAAQRNAGTAGAVGPKDGASGPQE